VSVASRQATEDEEGVKVATLGEEDTMKRLAAFGLFLLLPAPVLADTVSVDCSGSTSGWFTSIN
jgi:hypothetical protein